MVSDNFINMATKKAASNKKTVTREQILSTYMNQVLETEEQPKSVFKFCKTNKFTEEDFYKFFGSFENLKQSVWNDFFDHSLRLAHQNEQYESFNNKEKMLTFFYTFFELLTANRSYVLYALHKEHDMMRNMSQLKGLRSHIKEFAAGLITDANADKQLKILQKSVPVFSEGAWLQTLFILKYWMEDSSASFEKTDVVIEKSVRAIFDLFETSPLESVLDFGKFLWKDKMN